MKKEEISFFSSSITILYDVGNITGFFPFSRRQNEVQNLLCLFLPQFMQRRKNQSDGGRCAERTSRWKGTTQAGRARAAHV